MLRQRVKSAAASWLCLRLSVCCRRRLWDGSPVLRDHSSPARSALESWRSRGLMMNTCDKISNGTNTHTHTGHCLACFSQSQAIREGLPPSVNVWPCVSRRHLLCPLLYLESFLAKALFISRRFYCFWCVIWSRKSSSNCLPVMSSIGSFPFLTLPVMISYICDSCWYQYDSLWLIWLYLMPAFATLPSSLLKSSLKSLTDSLILTLGKFSNNHS